ncbi:unnamed protein product [Callosobruchus maculatus]|uniref:Uncharacterized protein n=1 Tax=Callosobruchus maculatus TaxID=64391 RepID=A0A653D467_CALMS|nr:unnamed protein product [Callosobruchus maculatus]
MINSYNKQVHVEPKAWQHSLNIKFVATCGGLHKFGLKNLKKTTLAVAHATSLRKERDKQNGGLASVYLARNKEKETKEIIGNEEMATKHEADEVDDRVAGINRIKTEPSGDDPDKCDVDSKEPIKTMSELESPTTSGIVEQVFVKTENDPDSGGTALPSIKSEPPGDEWDKCIAEDKSILEMEAENYKLDMEMSGQVKSELLIKKEWDDDPAAVYEVSASRIKEDADRLEAGPAGGVKEEADMDDEEYQLTEDCDIKSESDASMDAASDEPSNSMGKIKLI